MMSKLYKLIFDVSVCYTIGAFLLNYLSGITINGGSFLILLITALVFSILNQKRKLITFTTILIPVIYLTFFLPSIPELVVFVFIWVYLSYMFITERLVISRGRFMDMLKRFLYSCLILPFFMVTALQEFGTAVQTACPYLIMALVSAVFLLRHLRAVNQMEQMKLYRRQQFLELLAFLAICLLLTLARVPQNLVEGLRLMYQNLLVPILSLLASIIAMLIGAIIYLIISVLIFITKNNDIETKVNSGNVMDQYVDIININVANADWVIPLMYSIGAIIGMVLLLIFFRWLMGEKLKQNIPTGILETREYINDVKEKKTAFWKGHRNDSRATVRYYYGKSLIWLQHKRVQLKAQDTTEEINEKYSSLPTVNLEEKREASAQLMQIYRKARYQMTEEITKEEAGKAKQLYQNIKK